MFDVNNMLFVHIFFASCAITSLLQQQKLHCCLYTRAVFCVPRANELVCQIKVEGESERDVCIVCVLNVRSFDWCLCLHTHKGQVCYMKNVYSAVTYIFYVFTCLSPSLSLSVPYDHIVKDSGLVEMFGYVGAPRCKNVVAIGAIAGLTVSMFGSMFPMPRIVYAMAKDGLIFQ